MVSNEILNNSSSIRYLNFTPKFTTTLASRRFNLGRAQSYAL